MPGIIRTYWCADAGGILHRKDNLTGLWLNKDIPDPNIKLNDVKSNPANGDRVYTVGNSNAIYYSSDAGDTWTLSNMGAFDPSTEWYEVWPIDTNNIVAVGSLGSFAYSTNGGAVFTSPVATPFAASGSIRAVHFITPLIGVIGYQNLVYKTIDGGVTWTLLNSPGFTHVDFSATEINGIHISQTQQVIVAHANTGIWTSTDSGATFIQTFNNYVQATFVNNVNVFIAAGKHLTWYDDNTLWGTGDYNTILQSTNGGLTWNTQQTSMPFIGITETRAAHFYSSTEGFYSIHNQLFSSSDAGVTGSLTSVTGIDFSITAVWTALPGPCYNLLNCEGSLSLLLVDNDLSQFIGQVIMVDGECFTVQLAQSCQGATTITTPITNFADCCSCNPPACYELRDCTAESPVIVTNTDLASYVGKTVKVCEFTVSPVIPIQGLVTTCTGSDELGFVTQITGPTSGFYYESSSGLIKPYTNPLLLSLNFHDQICVNSLSPFNVVSSQNANFDIQYFIGTTPITNVITVNVYMPIPTLQFFIDQEIIFPNTVITVNTFDAFNNLNTTIIIKSPVPEGPLNVTVINLTNPTFPPTITITDDLVGACICYTVFDIGPGCNCTTPFTGVISGVFPDCECCLPPPPPEPEPPYIPTPPEIDKHTYKISESECDIDANKAFASAMYDKFKVDQYGIAPCCNINQDKVWIAKELSDLSKIKC